MGAVEFAHYALAVLASPSYRARHDAALHIDYPRIAPPRDRVEFDRLRIRGCALAALFCDPLNSSEANPTSGATLGQVTIDVQRAELRLGKEVLATLSQGALELRIGQHRPVQGFLRAHAKALLDVALLRALGARVDALAASIDSSS